MESKTGFILLARVAERVEAHNNRGLIANNTFFSTLKLGYYHLFAMLYAVVGHCAHVVMVNSTWTHDHIRSLWGHTTNLHIVYPPCDTEQFKGLPLITDADKELKTITPKELPNTMCDKIWSAKPKKEKT